MFIGFALAGTVGFPEGDQSPGLHWTSVFMNCCRCELLTAGPLLLFQHCWLVGPISCGPPTQHFHVVSASLTGGADLLWTSHSALSCSFSIVGNLFAFVGNWIPLLYSQWFGKRDWMTGLDLQSIFWIIKGGITFLCPDSLVWHCYGPPSTVFLLSLCCLSSVLHGREPSSDGWIHTHTWIHWCWELSSHSLGLTRGRFLGDRSPLILLASSHLCWGHHLVFCSTSYGYACYDLLLVPSWHHLSPSHSMWGCPWNLFTLMINSILLDQHPLRLFHVDCPCLLLRVPVDPWTLLIFLSLAPPPGSGLVLGLGALGDLSLPVCGVTSHFWHHGGCCELVKWIYSQEWL